LADAEILELDLLPENDFLPDFSEISSDAARKAKLMLLNFPGNPTAAVAPLRVFQEAVAFANDFSIVIAHDAPYSEASMDGVEVPSFLQAEGAKDVGIEFHSCSKAFNMPGWRMAHAVGNSEVLSALGRLRANIDMGQFEPIQLAAADALENGADFSHEMAKLYQARRDVVCDGLDALGWNIRRPKATFFIWTPVPCPMSSMDFAMQVLEKAGIIITPGIGFGSNGEGFVRIALTNEVPRLQEAVDRIKQAGLIYS
jgi:LL-diaminopimelate aminotransferase